MAVAPALLGAAGTGASVRALLAAYVVAGGAYVVAAVVVLAAGSGSSLGVGRAGARAWARTPMAPTARAGAAVLALSNLVMVAVMTMAPLHLHHAGLGLAGIGLVNSAHIAGMFAPAPVSGWVVHRAGARAAAGLAAVLLTVACLLAGAGGGRAVLVAGLVLLGVAWNLALVAGSALLTGDIPLAERPRREGLGEVGAALAAALGGAGSGLVMAEVGYAGLAVAGAVVGATTAVPVALLGVGARRRAAREPGVVVGEPCPAHRRVDDGSPRGG